MKTQGVHGTGDYVRRYGRLRAPLRPTTGATTGICCHVGQQGKGQGGGAVSPPNLSSPRPCEPMGMGVHAVPSLCAPTFRIPHFAFRVSNSAYRISHFAFRIPHFAFRVSHFAFSTTHFAFRKQSSVVDTTQALSRTFKKVGSCRHPPPPRQDASVRVAAQEVAPLHRKRREL